MCDKEEELQEKFVLLLKEKIPRHLANTLMEILSMEREAVYRRLRGDVAFSFFEMATLSMYLGISLDRITNIVSPYRSQGYQLHMRDYNEFKPIDLNMSHNYIEALHMAADDPDSEFGIAANMVPLHISLLHPPVYLVYVLKWKYQFGNTPKNHLNYSTLELPEEEKDTYDQYLEAVTRIKHTSFIWDNSFIVSLINDINYFHNIEMINREEIHMLKQETGRLLDTLEHYADKGKFDRTGNKIETYVSSLNFENSYSYLSGNHINISMSSAYSLGAFTSIEKDACEGMKKWVLGLKRSSNLISGVAQRDKIFFFKKQRDNLEKLFVINE